VPEISIVVPHLNQPGFLDRLLRSLCAQTVDMNRTEIIVVDNGSETLPSAITGRFPHTRLIAESVPGPGPARNAGVAIARAPILAFIDADCVADPGWVAAILARLRDPAAPGIVGGDVRILQETPEPTPIAAYEAVYAYRQKLYIEVMKFSGAGNMAVRREIFDAVGPFAGIDVAEDNDWGQRATALGHRIVYAPEMIVCHPARASLAELYVKWDRHIDHHFAVVEPGPLGRLKWAARTLGIAASPSVELPRILASDRIRGPKARLRAFRTLVAVRLYRARRMLSLLVRPPAASASRQWNREPAARNGPADPPAADQAARR
jgi:GT2 family glycosyltransferase